MIAPGHIIWRDMEDTMAGNRLKLITGHGYSRAGFELLGGGSVRCERRRPSDV